MWQHINQLGLFPKEQALFRKKNVITQWLIGCVFHCLIISECTKISLMLISPILSMFTCFDVQILCSATLDLGETLPYESKWKLLWENIKMKLDTLYRYVQISRLKEFYF